MTISEITAYECQLGPPENITELIHLQHFITSSLHSVDVLKADFSDGN